MTFIAMRLPFYFSVPLVGLCLLSGWRLWRVLVGQLRWRELIFDGAWFLREAPPVGDGESRHGVELCGEALCYPWLVIVPICLNGVSRPCHLWLNREVLTAQDFHLLRLVLLHHAVRHSRMR